MRDNQILHVQVPLALVGVLLDVQEVGAILREHRRDVRGHVLVPGHVLVRRDRLEPAGRVVLPLRGVRRRRDADVGARVVQEFQNDRQVAAVTADQAVRPDGPQVARPGDRIGWRLGDRILLHVRAGLRFVASQEILQLVVGEAHEREVHAVHLQVAQLRGKDLLVPPGVERELVVRDDVRAPLSLAEMIQNDDWHLSESQLASSQETTVARDDPGVTVYQDRSVETELRDGRRDLRHLLRRVRPRVLRVRHQPVGGPHFDAPRHRGRD